MTAEHADVAALADHLSDAGLAALAPTELAIAIYTWYVADSHGTGDSSLCPFTIAPAGALRGAHPHSTVFDGGWIAESVSTLGRVVARNAAGDSRVLDRCDYEVPRRRGSLPDPGDQLLVTRRLDWLSDGWWYTQFGTWPPPTGRIERLYLHVAPRGVVPALRWLASDVLGNRDAIVKVLIVGDDARVRRDTIVAAVAPDALGAVASELRHPPAQVAGHLMEATPRFCEVLGPPGVARAQGSTNGESFGQELSVAIAARVGTLKAAARHDREAVRRAIVGGIDDCGRDTGRPALYRTCEPAR